MTNPNNLPPRFLPDGSISPAAHAAVEQVRATLTVEAERLADLLALHLVPEAAVATLREGLRLHDLDDDQQLDMAYWLHAAARGEDLPGYIGTTMLDDLYERLHDTDDPAQRQDLQQQIANVRHLMQEGDDDGEP